MEFVIQEHVQILSYNKSYVDRWWVIVTLYPIDRSRARIKVTESVLHTI